ncbi:hypothetical protein MED121_17379 [Marinomonas sp. MED121]|nr:hypothetical protein MED121_17379 [Marinomonas sp. MED121]
MAIVSYYKNNNIFLKLTDFMFDGLFFSALLLKVKRFLRIFTHLKLFKLSFSLLKSRIWMVFI